ncbi:hypothetical protein niasHT_027680 [Heterodera trifolii]|uniref:Uncharacterized protein n=1 Tax=Heterodera trifolii TaxID=157864 RepID=A0ABD2KAN1_9BILA
MVDAMNREPEPGWKIEKISVDLYCSALSDPVIIPARPLQHSNPDSVFNEFMHRQQSFGEFYLTSSSNALIGVSSIEFQKRTVAHGCFPHEPVPIGGVHPFDVAAPHEPVPIGGVHPFDVAAPHKPVPIGGVQPFDVAAPHEPVPIGGVHPFDVAAPHQPVPIGGVQPFDVAAQRTQTYWTSLKLPPRTETYWTTLKLPPTQTNFPKSATQIRFPQIRTGAFFLLIPPHRYQSRKLINKKINNTSPLSSTSSVPVAMPSREKTNRYDTAHSHRR